MEHRTHTYRGTDNRLWSQLFKAYLVSMSLLVFVIVGCHSDQEYLWPPYDETDTDNSEDNGGGDADADADTDADADSEGDADPLCNPEDEPTWDNPINQIMQQQCTSCHSQCSSYEGIINWVDDEDLLYYTNKNHYWGSNENAGTTASWIRIGMPESDCDVQ